MFEQFQNQNFLNLETFRKNGEGVKTPVWFVLEGEKIYVRTIDNSWKVKRIRRNPQVRLVPSDVRGTPVAGSTWQTAQAHLISDSREAARINDLFNKKYGLQKRMFDLMGVARKSTYATIEIRA